MRSDVIIIARICKNGEIGMHWAALYNLNA